MGGYGLGHCLRITVGDADENRRLLAGLDEVLAAAETELAWHREQTPGFRADIAHLSPLGLRTAAGGVRVANRRAIDEPVNAIVAAVKATLDRTPPELSGDIMDRNWVHLRDGTGSAAAKSNDLIVTTTQKAKVGDVVLVSGVVRTDANYGSGYAYPVVIENAKLD